MADFSPTTIVVRELRGDDSIEEITALLHLAYASLAAMGFFYLASHQSAEITRERLGEGIALVAESNGVLVGTLTLASANAASRCAWYRQPGVWKFGQFAVHPHFQGHGVGVMLLRDAENRARLNGARELALDTAEGALHLVNWYQRLGFRMVQHVDWDETNYRSVVLSKNLAD